MSSDDLLKAAVEEFFYAVVDELTGKKPDSSDENFLFTTKAWEWYVKKHGNPTTDEEMRRAFEFGATLSAVAMLHRKRTEPTPVGN